MYISYIYINTHIYHTYILYHTHIPKCLNTTQSGHMFICMYIFRFDHLVLNNQLMCSSLKKTISLPLLHNVLSSNNSCPWIFFRVIYDE